MANTDKTDKAASTQKLTGADIWLPKEVSNKFKTVDWVGGHEQNFGRWGMINLKEMTLRRAETLVRKGFPKLAAR